jgi:hypothetical protein
MQPAKRSGQEMETTADRTGIWHARLQSALRLGNAEFAADLKIGSSGRCLASGNRCLRPGLEMQ